MNITLRKGNLEEQACDLLIVNEFSKWEKFGGATGAVDDRFDGRLLKIAKEEGFKGEKSETILVRTFDGFPAKRILLVGLGEQKDFSSQVVREVSATAYRAAKKLRANHVVSILHGAGAGKLPAGMAVRAQVEGVRLGAYEFVKLKKTPDEKPHEIKEWEIVTNDGNHLRAGKRGAELGEIVARGTIFARDLVNEPAMEMTPKNLARVAEAVGKNSGGKVKVKLLTREEMKKLGMGGVLGVAQGSDHGPVFVHMEYEAPKAKRRVSLVGKAVTFDSGGLSLKPWDMMTHMKCDMAGAAAVLGVFSVLAQLQPKLHVDGIFAAVENMPSGCAIRPGDVLKAMNGKTMEVLNTDAEGRLTLADALSYTSALKPDFMIDLATLTGACMVALGEEISGLMGNDTSFNERLIKSAAEAGESVWPLPLDKRYRKLIDSKVADIQNLGGGKYGAAITAGLFLQEFVGEGIPWAHVDIAGPAFAQTPINPYTQYGGTGAGVPMLIELLRSL